MLWWMASTEIGCLRRQTSWVQKTGRSLFASAPRAPRLKRWPPQSHAPSNRACLRSTRVMRMLPTPPRTAQTARSWRSRHSLRGAIQPSSFRSEPSGIRCAGCRSWWRRFERRAAPVGAGPAFSIRAGMGARHISDLLMRSARPPTFRSNARSVDAAVASSARGSSGRRRRSIAEECRRVPTSGNGGFARCIVAMGVRSLTECSLASPAANTLLRDAPSPRLGPPRPQPPSNAELGGFSVRTAIIQQAPRVGQKD